MDLDCPAGRLIAKALVDFRFPGSPVSFPIECIKFFFGTCMMMRLFGKAFQIFLTFSFGPSAPVGLNDLFDRRFFRFRIRKNFCLIEERQLPVNDIQLFRMAAETGLIRYADLFDQLFIVRLQCVDLLVLCEYDLVEFSSAQGIQFFRSIQFAHQAALLYILLYRKSQIRANPPPDRDRHFAYGCNTPERGW